MKIKKLAVFISVFIVFSFFVACDPAHYEHKYETLLETVVRIELVKYDNPNAKELFEKRDKVKSIDIDKVEVVEILQEEKKEEFLKDFCDCLFLKVWRHMDSPNGWCLRLLFNNESFELVSVKSDFSGIFDEDGNVIEFIGSGICPNVVVNHYFQEQLDNC